jgi:hypothetical protein
MTQEGKDMNASRMYLDLAHECFNKAAMAEQAEAAETFRRMGRRYTSEAAAFDAIERGKRPRGPGRGAKAHAHLG